MRHFLILLFGMLTAFPAFTAGLITKQNKYLTDNEAFTFSSQFAEEKLQLHWQIADGYYLYKKEITVQSKNATLGEPLFPQSESHQDEFFGTVDIFRHQLNIDIPVNSVQQNASVEVRYQGCTKGFCYPPKTVVVELNQQAVGFEQNFAKNSKKLTEEEKLKSEQNILIDRLYSDSFSVFWFFPFGLALAFTPCVLPMLPLLSAIVIGQKNRPNTLRAFLLSFSYVQGMALTYTLLGLIVTAVGLPFQILLQSPPVLIVISLLFVVLAFSMFGLYEIRLPHSWQQKLNNLSQQQKGGYFTGVFVMGVLAGLIASPCTSVPLSAALLYVVQSGDFFVGGFALYLLALGMGVPLMLLTLFGNKILPKSGSWLLKVKTLFGFVMLMLPIFLLSRVFPAYQSTMWSLLAMFFFIWLFRQIPQTKSFSINYFLVRYIKIVIFSTILMSVWLIMSELPIFKNSQENPIPFTQIHSVSDLEQQLVAGKGKKVMLDLYADWCAACKEFENYTFRAPQVRQQFEKMVLLRIDMTKNSAENDELMKRFQILGLPTILFFDEQGNELSYARVTGFMKEKDFSAWLKKL
ncbi:protein-disulfide reductase DsbD [Glaesserella sp.]|uniref:protein-disulfide reductase DsbD n=1 Tax=Glaesserella sp. TaxID=2094731 RepID=UPI0035A1BA87